MKQQPIRIVEVTCCGECPHCDARWSEPPYQCDELNANVWDLTRIRRGCPLDKKPKEPKK